MVSGAATVRSQTSPIVFKSIQCVDSVHHVFRFVARCASIPSPRKFDWDFGDGTTDTTSTPVATHPYSALGLYYLKVSYLATDTTVPSHPNAQSMVAVSPTGAPLGNRVLVVSSPFPDTVAVYSWWSVRIADPFVNVLADYGDDTTVYVLGAARSRDSLGNQIYGHGYLKPGTYHVKFMAYDTNGWIGIDSSIVTSILPPVPTPIVGTWRRFQLGRQGSTPHPDSAQTYTFRIDGSCEGSQTYGSAPMEGAFSVDGECANILFHGTNTIEFSDRACLQGHDTLVSTGFYISSYTRVTAGLGEADKLLTSVTCYPNPVANGKSTIAYTLAKPGIVTLSIFDCLGRMLETSEHRHDASGTYLIDFDAAGRTPGVYTCVAALEGKMNSTRLVVY